jgi:prevent-host-death family protein
VHVFKLRQGLKFGAVHGLLHRPALLILGVSPFGFFSSCVFLVLVLSSGVETGHQRRSTTMSAHAIDLQDAQAHLLQLVEQAKHGHEVILTEGGEPVAKIIPVSAPAKRQFGSAKGLITMSEDFDEPLEDFREYM